MPILLTESDVRSLVTMPDLIAAMEPALAAFSSGTVVQPVRTVLDLADRHAFFGLMPSYVPSIPNSLEAKLGAKLVTVYHSNLERGLPSHLATILLFDPQTGALDAIVDGRYITEARTAAVSAVSAKKLARSDSKILAILGSGVQARSHLEALNCVLEFEEVSVWSPSQQNCSKFAAEIPAHMHASAQASARAAVHGADVIALVTASPTPVIQAGWVKPGAHIMAVGACRPTQREMDPDLVARSSVYVDSRAAALQEAGDIVMAIDEGKITAGHIIGEIGEAISRKSRDEITIFKSLGLAVEDVASAHLAVTRARVQARGATV